MITCRELAELLLEFLSDELPPDRQEHVKHHLGVCPPCVHLVETYRITIRLSRQLPCEPLPSRCEQRLRAALEKGSQEDPT
jgi:anti-sigma factor RsiW